MESENALAALSALAQPTRMDAFRALVKTAPDGIAAGELARTLGVPANTLSSHLAILAQAGLVRSVRHSRSITYSAELDALRAVIAFLLKDCCGGNPAICTPLVAELQPCCSPALSSSCS